MRGLGYMVTSSAPIVWVGNVMRCISILGMLIMPAMRVGIRHGRGRGYSMGKRWSYVGCSALEHMATSLGAANECKEIMRHLAPRSENILLLQSTGIVGSGWLMEDGGNVRRGVRWRSLKLGIGSLAPRHGAAEPASACRTTCRHHEADGRKHMSLPPSRNNTSTIHPLTTQQTIPYTHHNVRPDTISTEVEHTHPPSKPSHHTPNEPSRGPLSRRSPLPTRSTNSDRPDHHPRRERPSVNRSLSSAARRVPDHE